jgi:cytochrome c-type biogenesis protein CcmF
MLRVWNVTLVVLTFLLTIFQTFMTRTGVVQSVHAFGEDPELARLFIIFMIALAVFGFGWVIYRLPMLKARNELESWASREGAFMANNWILLFSAFFILFATMFPTIAEAVTGERLTVGPPFFNKWMTPVGLILLLLTGIGPLLAWRKTSMSNMAQQFAWPVISAIVIGGGMVALGVPFWASGLCFALCGFVFGTVVQEFVRGATVRKATIGADLLTAMVGLVGRNKRRYGGYVVHLGIVLMFLGFAGEAMSRDEQLLLHTGDQATVGHFRLRLDALRVSDDGQKQMVTAHITVMDEDGREIDRMEPAKWYFRKHENTPTTEVAIRRRVAEDLYIVLPGYDVKEQSASLEVHINPLVNWIWFGFGVLAVGTLIALLPETAVAFALSKVPATGEAVTTSMLLLALALSPAVAWAQGKTVDPKARSPLYRQLEDRIMCVCGCHSPMGSCPMRPNCAHYDEQAVKLASHLAKGMDGDAVMAAFVTEYGGQDVLAAPIDRGFNRLAWFVPYVVGSVGLVAGVFAVARWSRRRATSAGDGGEQADEAALGSRLDDELRNLD